MIELDQVKLRVTNFELVGSELVKSVFFPLEKLNSFVRGVGCLIPASKFMNL